MLIQRAYDVEPFQVVGPAWMDGPRYNIGATLPVRTSAEECKLMLSNLLAERFLLRQHAEARPFRVFQLVVSKGGPKLAPEKSRTLAEGQDRKSASFSAMAEHQKAAKELGFRPTQSFFADSNSMAQLAARLSQFLDRPAVDMTGLSGTYSVSLSWVGDGDGPSLEEALREQLGLELRPATQDLRVIEVDAAERNPTGN
jgi:uncharacterized protein (TIGR03435 family)